LNGTREEVYAGAPQSSTFSFGISCLRSVNLIRKNDSKPKDIREIII
jgi:hypothetical protein